MTLLGVDIGTPRINAGLFAEDGTPLRLASRPTPVRPLAMYPPGYAPEQRWRTVAETIAQVTAASPTPIAAIGLASMAETGLLLDRRTGQPRTNFIPWFDQSAAPQARQLRQAGEAAEQFCTFGIYPSFKCSLAKILWLGA